MKWKDFFKPSIFKIILTIIFLIILNFAAGFADILRLTLVYLIPFYLMSCVFVLMLHIMFYGVLQHHNPKNKKRGKKRKK